MSNAVALTNTLSNSGGGTWQYQKEIAIQENSGKLLTDCQILVELYSSDFPIEAQSNDDDIRFTEKGRATTKEVDVILLSSTLHKGKILFDESHNTYLSASITNGYSSFANLLRIEGYQVDRSTSSLSFDDLKGNDILVIADPFTPPKPFSTSEIEAINKFVNEGGGLLLIGVGWSWVDYSHRSIDAFPLNQISKEFGVSFNEDVISDPTNYYPTGGEGNPIFHVPYMTDHPTTKGINEISACGGNPCSLKIINNSVQVIIKGDEDSYTGYHSTHYYPAGENPPIVAVTEYGNGKVVFLGHDGFFANADDNEDGISNLYEYDNTQLGLNFMDWLVSSATPTTPTPTSIENHPPTANRIEPASYMSIAIEDTITFQVRAEDPDEDADNNLHMVQWFIDDGWIETDPADGTSEEASFMHTFENSGTYSVKATVYDEQMEEDSIVWEVNAGGEEPVGLIEEEIKDKEGAKIGLKVVVEHPTTLSQGELGYIDIKLKTEDFEDATFLDDYTNLKSGSFFIASDEDIQMLTNHIMYEVSPVPQTLHHEAFGWEDYYYYLQQEKNEWGMKALERILVGLQGASQAEWLVETLNWNPLEEIKYDIGRAPMNAAFYDNNNYDYWTFDWTFYLFSISKLGHERRGNGVHLRIPFTYEKPGQHKLHLFLFIDDYTSYGVLAKQYTIGKEYSFDINVGGKGVSDLTNEKTDISLEEEKGILGFEAIFAIAGLLAVAYILRRNKR